MSGCLKWFGIILILCSFGIIGFGLLTTSSAVSETVPDVQSASDATLAGVGIGASLSIGVFGCIAVIFFIVGIIAFFVGNSGQQKNKQLKLQQQALGVAPPASKRK